MKDLKNLNVVITGASSGIGAELARQLARAGARVALVARREDALREVAKSCGDRCYTIVADVTVRDEVKRVVRDVVQHFGHVDVWVNNVGRGITRMPTELTDADVDDMISVNVKSALYGMQEILPHFRERGRGQIVNVSSMLGRLPFATMRSAYNGAKHFLNAITTNFRDELRQSAPGIEVTLVSPGVVRTDFGLNALHGGMDSRQFPQSQSAEEVAAVIVWAIRTGKSDVYTRAGAKQGVAEYFSRNGEDPEQAVTA
ncbi:MAG TPA: SDR family NAD(P)-dependent oxidoreductase [Gemmatimonadaceae bacterium]|nr:SDR family NAD(P)-dependent oxidoreductase [Gemmatimonadaceae bacterium]